MDTPAREQIAALLEEVGDSATFTARRTAMADDLHLEVKGFGPLRFPIPRADAEKLCRLARPARYGKGEETLLDRQVRDTWEIPKSRVKIDRRRWNRTLLPMLESLRADLGLPAGCRMKAALHAMLVYAPGQFFLSHQDSEKADDMVGTLVVTLPSSFKGGAFVIEHQGEKVTYGATKQPLSFVAFYADCQHEVRPVKAGYRIVLTYNLMLVGDETTAASFETEPAMIDALAARLREHFETSRPSRSWEKDAPLREPPNRLVYLLDHQYTERGFGWQRLKGSDAARVAALRAAGECTDCEMMLALAEIQETWSAMEEGWGEPWYGRGRYRRWIRDEDEEWYVDDEPRVDGPDRYTLDDLLDWSIELKIWVPPSREKAEPIVGRVDVDEVCATTPTAAIAPYASEYEGYMGNYGNTMERWYRRAALLLWPRERAFAIRAEAAPAWALRKLRQRLRADSLVEEAQAMVASLLPFWKSVAPYEKRRGFSANALRVAAGLDHAELAAALLEPFQVEALTPSGARALVRLVERYGEEWVWSVLADWKGARRPWRGPDEPDPFAWLTSLPRLAEALCVSDDTVGLLAGQLLLEDRWRWLMEEIEKQRSLEIPRLRDKALAALPAPLLGFLESAVIVEADELQEEALAYLCSDTNEPLLSHLVQLLRSAAKSMTPTLRAALDLEVLAEHCTQHLETRLAVPARSADDWSIALPKGCSCKLCAELGAFLTDPLSKRLDWPLAKEKRGHVHGRIDAHELPVRHQTKRSGRPYTLVLEKTKALFEREARERRSWKADLAWLTKSTRTWRE